MLKSHGYCNKISQTGYFKKQMFIASLLWRLQILAQSIKSCLFSEDMVYKWSECPSLFALIITMNTLQPKPDARLC